MVSPVMPALTGNGLSMRTGIFLEALAKVATVDLLVVPVFGRSSLGDSRWAARASGRIDVLDGIVRDTHASLIERLTQPEDRLQAFARYGKPSLSSLLSSATIRQAERLLRGRSFDLIHVERSYCAALGRAMAAIGGSDPILTIDLDEDDGRVYARLAGFASQSADQKSWNLLEASAFRKLQQHELPFYKKVWVSSAIESASLAACSSVKADVVPNSVIRGRRLSRQDDGRTMLFVGSLGYAPNQEALDWFLRSIWPRLSNARKLRLRIVGANAPRDLQRRARQPGVEMVGWVPDVARDYASATIAIVPIRIGAGTRIKLIEASLFGVPVVSTAVGAEGLGLRRGQHLWIADSAPRFVEAVLDAFNRPAERRRRAHAARARVKALFDRETTIERLAREFMALL